MDRREFLLRAGLISAVSTRPTGLEVKAKVNQISAQGIGRKGNFDLANECLAWHLEWSAGRLRSSGFRNKLSGHIFLFSEVQELVLTFSASKRRVEIPWWSFVFGPDQAPVSPDQEKGFALGYHRPDFSPKGWGNTENLLLRGLRGIERSRGGIAFEGYGWFRFWFALPNDAEGEELVFVLGGYDHQDWNEYWIYVNGVEIGHRTSSGRWRTSGRFALGLGNPAFPSLRFGSGEKNLLAVRARGYDKHFGGLGDEVLKHYVFEPVLVDQFMSVGQPFLQVSDLEVQELKQLGGNKVCFELRSPSYGTNVSVYYELDGPTRRKWVEVKNETGRELLLLDVQLDDFRGAAPTSEGGQGEPVFIGDEAFCALEHPAGLNQGEQGRIRLMHFPGRRLPPGGAVRSHVALVSVAKTQQALEQFISYIQGKSPRKKRAISIYDPFGINNQWGGCPTLNDGEMLNGLKVLETWQKKGLRFDYYVPDTGWVDHASDLTRFAPECFPNGPTKIVERLKALGMKFGLWFAVSWGAESCSEYPPVWASKVPVAGEPSEGASPHLVYRNGYPVGGGPPATLCLASEPYFSILRNAVLYHIRRDGLKFFKLDGINHYCNSSRHEHLPGKYSIEAVDDRLLEIAGSARRADPDVYVMWYWGARSPFFALYGDSIFESGLYMEGSGTSWFPTLYYRDSVTLNLDQSTQFAKTIPPINKDSLGIWLADTRWGNFMGTERWKEALIMDLGRGNLLFPQLWGDIYLLDDKDVDFLAEISSLVKRTESLFLKRRNILGDPWKNEVYGYGYFQGVHGLLFISNVHFASRKAELMLGPSVGLEADPGTPVQIISHFPERKRIVREGGSGFRVGDRAEVWMRPFETLMLEVVAGGRLYAPAA